ncbi:zeta toxin family protein [Prosthecobacter dejongeii]
MVFDTVMADSKRGIKLMNQALAKGHRVTLQYIHQPLMKAVENSITRAMDKDNGRIVPAAVVAATHLRAQQALYELAAHYAADPRVSVKVIDHENFAARPSSLAELKSKRYTQSMEELQQQAVKHARQYLETQSHQTTLTDDLKSRILELSEGK